jgi:hypothetical protein
MDVPTPSVPDAADLALRLRETEAELARVTLRLRRLEDSTSVRLAQLLAAAVRNPRTAPASLRQAAALIGRRARRHRGGAGASSGPSGERDAGGARAARGRPKPAAAPPAAGGNGGADGAHAADRLPDRLLAASAVLVTTRDRPVLAVVADPDSARAWGEDAHVQLLRPDDALVVFAAVTPDVLVIDAAAGRGGPWSGLGTYEVPERDRTVLDLLRAARDRGVPAVLVPPDPPEEGPMLADAGELFSRRVSRGAAVADLVAAAQVLA